MLPMAAPQWMKIVRQEKTITGWVSYNGQQWWKVTSTVIPMPNDDLHWIGSDRSRIHASKSGDLRECQFVCDAAANTDQYPHIYSDAFKCNAGLWVGWQFYDNHWRHQRR